MLNDKNRRSVEIMANRVNNQRKRNSKERMARAYLQLIQDKKASDISVSELCNLANVNRTTFYNNYQNTSELAEEIREELIREYSDLYTGNTDGPTPENYLRMFRHIKDNQIFYHTYFRLCPDSRGLYKYYDKNLARLEGKDKHVEYHVEYHVEFFAAGITAIIKKWLDSGCKESPEEMLDILMLEYGRK